MAASFVADLGGDDVALNSSTATLLYTASHRASASEPELILVQNNSAIIMTIGGSDVAKSSKGVVLAADGNNSVTWSLRNPGVDKIYGISATGTPSAQVVRT